MTTVKRVAGVLALAALVLLIGALGAEATQPNILFVIGDDAGWPFYHFMGHAVVKTPNLDRLAAEGVVYPNGQVTYPACEQSLRALARGVHNRDVERTNPDQVLLPRALEALGYRTWAAGKWRDGEALVQVFTDATAVNLQIGREPGSMQLVADAVDRMSGSPWFIWLAPPLPHAPHDAPEPYRSMYAGVDPDPEDLYRLEYGVQGTRNYYATITWFDAVVGEALAILEARGLLESTVIVYLSDNGAGLRRSKGSFMEAGIRTPIIVRGPGIAPRRDEALVASIDLYPTVIEMAGGVPPARYDARSLTESLAGGPAPRETWVSNMTTSGPFAIRDTAGRKVYTTRAGAVTRVSDLAADPFEQVDVKGTAAGAAAIQDLLPALNAWRERR